MTRSMSWRCDHCGTIIGADETIEIDPEVHAAQQTLQFGDWPPGPNGPEAPPGWINFADNEHVYDLCPSCSTVDERAEAIVDGALGDFYRALMPLEDELCDADDLPAGDD